MFLYFKISSKCCFLSKLVRCIDFLDLSNLSDLSTMICLSRLETHQTEKVAKIKGKEEIPWLNSSISQRLEGEPEKLGFSAVPYGVRPRQKESANLSVHVRFSH